MVAYKLMPIRVFTTHQFRKELLMKKPILLTMVVASGLLWVLASISGYQAHAQGQAFVRPTVFQAAGPTAESIQGTLDEFRAALGDPNNASNPGPLATGRREINWDGGGGVSATTDPVTPFDVFLNTRGAQFTTRGDGLSQATEDGLATLFSNQTYTTQFLPFSPLRMFTPVGSNVTEALFFIPGSDGATPAAVRGFGAIFIDVDQPEGSGPGRRANRRASTLMECFDAGNNRVYSGFVPASPGEANLSFLGVVFDEARIARVRITTGNVAPGPDDDAKRDIVVMDDFIYGEPQAISAAPMASAR
jgi:hypothetical protein